MTLYQNKYRIETTRLRNYNYASDGRYFITICTHGREHLFGNIKNGKMQLNAYGTIIENCWFDLVNHYPNLQLDAFVVMPNHIHGIMIIDNSKNMGGAIVSGDSVLADSVVETGFKPVSTTTDAIQTDAIQTGLKPDSTTPHGLFEFVRALKTFSSRRMNEMDNSPGKTRWQSRFHDHIIRNKQELFRIQQYICNNPTKWDIDSLKS